MANTLFMRLEGPLQAWGERGRWTIRDTGPEPTKSGIVGLLACALGLRGDAELRELSGQLQVGVRCEQPGTLLVDYHTVVGGVMSAEGKIKKNAATGEPETVVSFRHYLADASFLAAVQANPELVARLASALDNPRWPVYLGRKSCPPARPILEGMGDFDSMQAALAAWPLRRAGAAGATAHVRAVVECPPGTGSRRRDEVLSNARRVFGLRYTRDIDLEVPMEQEEACISPD